MTMKIGSAPTPVRSTEATAPASTATAAKAATTGETPPLDTFEGSTTTAAKTVNEAVQEIATKLHDIALKAKVKEMLNNSTPG